MKKLVLFFFIIAAFCSGFWGRTVLNVHAEESQVSEKSLYYTSIQIKQGDNLWSVANRYAEGSGYTTEEYIEELKRMNRLSGEQIRSGEYLTVSYVSN